MEVTVSRRRGFAAALTKELRGSGHRRLFNARVAGNIANDDIVGSMEFACKVAGAKVVLVMEWGRRRAAIKGAIDTVQLGKLTGLLTKIRPAVEATRYQGERSAKNYGSVDAVARKKTGTQRQRMSRPA